jgi:polysaccharide biosynthesis/export protein
MTVRFHSKNIARSLAGAFALAVVAGSVAFAAQQQSSPTPNAAVQPTTPPPTATPVATVPGATQTVTAVPGAVMAAPGVNVPPEYTIGADDVLSVVFWRDKELTSDVTVRPDGKISLPLLNDVHASGLTPAQLKDRIVEESKKYVEDPNVTVVVKDIKSRKVFITGEVRKPGPYSMSGTISVLQLISIAGGLADYAKPEKIMIVRSENGKQMSFRFNYKEVIEGKKLAQNIDLKPGDAIIVP